MIKIKSAVAVITVLLIGANAQSQSSFAGLASSQNLAIQNYVTSIKTVTDSLPAIITNVKTQAAAATGTGATALTGLATALESLEKSLKANSNSTLQLLPRISSMYKSIDADFSKVTPAVSTNLFNSITNFNSYLQATAANILSLSKLELDISKILEATKAGGPAKPADATTLINDISNIVNAINTAIQPATTRTDNINKLNDILQGDLSASIPATQAFDALALAYNSNAQFNNFKDAANKAATVDVLKVDADTLAFIKKFVDPVVAPTVKPGVPTVGPGVPPVGPGVPPVVLPSQKFNETLRLLEYIIKTSSNLTNGVVDYFGGIVGSTNNGSNTIANAINQLATGSVGVAGNIIGTTVGVVGKLGGVVGGVVQGAAGLASNIANFVGSTISNAFAALAGAGAGIVGGGTAGPGNNIFASLRVNSG